MSDIKVIVFDFDGVLVDSEDFKRQSLKDNFLEFGEEFAQQMFDYQRETGDNRYGVSDYAAYKLGKDRAWADQYAEKYTKTVRDKIISMPCMDTCTSTLVKLVKKYPLYISSATPQDELEHILVRKTMRHMFKGAYGSPEVKLDHFSTIMAKESVSPEEILFIGDTESDSTIADAFGVQFLAINYRGDKSKVREIDKLWDIVAYLEK